MLVFRNASLELLAEPFTAGVITVPAPNKRGAAMFAPAGLFVLTYSGIKGDRTND